MSPAPSIRHILVPHDFSETAEHALAYALVLSEKLGARVSVLHAYEVPASAYPDAFVASFDFTSEIEQAAATALEEVKARALREQGQKVEIMLRRGVPWVEIDAAAAESKADLIVIGTHGRRGVARALLGSVAEKVVRTAPCPVLTVHGPEPKHETAPSKA
ncbi:MAG: universal stress protein [Polyangiaceae bacterium]